MVIWLDSILSFVIERYPVIRSGFLSPQNYASAAGIELFSPVSHTLFNPADIIQKVLSVVSVYALLDI